MSQILSMYEVVSGVRLLSTGYTITGTGSWWELFVVFRLNALLITMSEKAGLTLLHSAYGRAATKNGYIQIWWAEKTTDRYFII